MNDLTHSILNSSLKGLHKANAEKFLAILDAPDNPGDDNLYFIAHLRKELVSGELSYEEIGTTKEHIDKLHILGCKRNAEYYLNKLKHEVSSFDLIYVEVILMKLEEGKLTPRDIHTTAGWLKRRSKASVPK